MPCSNCPFRTDGAATVITPPRRWFAMQAKAAAGQPMPCHKTLRLDPIPEGGDWHLDAPVRVPCIGAAEAYVNGSLPR